MPVTSDLNTDADMQFAVNRVSVLQPFAWLCRGWNDLQYHRAASLAHGLLVTGLGWVILVFASVHIYLLAMAVSGFLLIGPIMATGLCELSRQRERGEPGTFDDSLDGVSRNGAVLVRFAAILLAISVLWFLMSVLILQAVFGSVAPSIRETLWGGFLDVVTPFQIIQYIAVGGILACAVFLISVVSIPAIIDRPVNALDAMRISIRSVSANLPAMLIWSGLIVLLTVIGFATFLLGMIVIYPLLGHATWYAYRDMIR